MQSLLASMDAVNYHLPPLSPRNPMNPIIGFRSIIHAAQKVSHTQRRRGIRAQDPIKAQKLRFKIEISVNLISNWIKNSSSSERKKWEVVM